MEIFLQDMSYKRRCRKVQHFFLKKKLSLKGQVEGKKEVIILSSFWVVVQLLELFLSFFQRKEKLYKSKKNSQALVWLQF